MDDNQNVGVSDNRSVGGLDNQVPAQNLITQAAPVLPSPVASVLTMVGGTPAGDKERMAAPNKPPEVSKVPEEQEIKEVEPEVESFLEKLEQSGEIKLPEAIKDEHGDVVLDNAPAVKASDVVVIPMTAAQVDEGKKGKVDNALTWLSLFFERVGKMLKSGAKFKAE